jgi:glycosyltransferase involved in cell wall biosynthesis
VLSGLKIALLHYSCPPVVGGVEEILHRQADLFHRYSHAVKVFAGTGEQYTSDYPVELNPLLGSRHSSVLAAQRLLEEEEDSQQVAMLAACLGDYLKKSLAGFDILIAHNVVSMAYNLPLTLAIRGLADAEALPIISWNHDSPYFYSNYLNPPDQDPWPVLRLPHPCIHYVAISETRRQQFRRLYGSGATIRVIPDAIDPSEFLMLDPLTSRLIHEERLFESDFVMLHPGRLHPRKNMELSIRVIRALLNRGIRAKLIITGAYDTHEAGTHEYYSMIMDLRRQLGLVDDVLILAGHRFRNGLRMAPDRIKMLDLYHIADVLFLPSRQEGFGIPLLEAGMIGLPVVCSTIPVFREIGGQEVCFIELEDSPKQIAGRIIDYVGGLQHGRLFRRVTREFTWDRIFVHKMLPLFEEITRHRYNKRLSHKGHPQPVEI